MYLTNAKEVTAIQRTLASGIAKLAGCSSAFVRKCADQGLVESRRDYNGWRVFPDPMGATQTIRKLLLGEPDGRVERENRAESSRTQRG